MQPYLLRVGSIYVHTYGVMLVVAFLVTIWLTARVARQSSHLAALQATEVGEWGSLTMLMGLAGGRAWYVVQSWEAFVHQPLEIPAIWHGGLVWYGGLLGGVMGSWLFARWRGRPVLRLFDFVVPFVALGHGIGRIGCFFNGCCYGEVTRAWYGVVFPQHPDELRVPTQLFEAGALVALYVLLRLLQRPKMLNRPGRLFGIYVVTYAGIRFFLEFLRGDQTVYWGPLTIPQVASLGGAMVGLVLVMVQWGGHGGSTPFRRSPPS